MSQDGFGTLSAGLVDRGNRRLELVLGGGASDAQAPNDAAARAFDLRTGTKAPERTVAAGSPPSLTAVPGEDTLVAFGNATYRRRSLKDIAREREEHMRNWPDIAWINSPTYQGPDRRSREVSPVVERRRSVAPRVKVTVRLEQERYLRLKLAAHELDRTQQDLMTAALDAYLDQFQVDRFQRAAAKPKDQPETEAAPRAFGRRAS